jgi:hypothetical protein
MVLVSRSLGLLFVQLLDADTGFVPHIASVLWALPNQTVDHLVPHAGTPSFTIAESSASASTTFSVFSVQSPIPVRQRVVPQTIRSIASYPIAPSTEPSTSFAPSVEDAPIALLVVTPSWDVLLIGDKETLPSLTSSSDATQSLATASSDAPSSARTLFDEIFGTSSAPPTAAAARPISAPKTYKSLGELFEGSAMVLPDMSMIYEEVLEGVLDLRKDSEDDEQDERADGEMELDEVEMGGNAERDSMGSVRKVGDAEVVRLEGLFRELFGSSPLPSSLSVSVLALTSILFPFLQVLPLPPRTLPRPNLTAFHQKPQTASPNLPTPLADPSTATPPALPHPPPVARPRRLSPASPRLPTHRPARPRTPWTRTRPSPVASGRTRIDRIVRPFSLFPQDPGLLLLHV